MEPSLLEVAKKQGKTAAIMMAFAQDPDHYYLRRRTSLKSLVQAYNQGNQTQVYHDFLWQRIIKGRYSYRALMKALNVCEANDSFWGILLSQLLDKAQTISQFQRVVRLCTKNDQYSVNQRRWCLVRDLLPQVDEIKALLALRKVAKGEGERDKNGESLINAKTLDNLKEQIDQINRKIFWAARRITSDLDDLKLLREIADNNLFDLGETQRQEVREYLN